MGRWVVGRLDGDSGRGYFVRDVPWLVLSAVVGAVADWCGRYEDAILGFLFGFAVGVLCFV